MIWFLARKNLRRVTGRTALLVTGVAISGALLFDMAMLGGGLERSFGAALGRLGYEIRVVLHGTLPLSTEALMPDAVAVARRIAAHPDVALASPVLGTGVYVESAGGRASSVALGLRPDVHGLLRDDAGRTVVEGLMVNHELARRLKLRPGDVVRVASSIDPQTGRPVRMVEIRVRGVAAFAFDLRAQRTIALPLSDLQNVLGVPKAQASFVVVKTRAGADPEAVVRWIETGFPLLDAFSIPGLLAQVRRQLIYFDHFAVILGGISLLMAFLLISAVLTLSVGERLGELAVLEAIGLSRARVVLLVVLEGVAVAGVSAPLALLVGLAVSRPLDAILSAAPGVPQDLQFFVLSGRAVARTVGLLMLTGVVGAAYPAWIIGRLNIATILHREAQ